MKLFAVTILQSVSDPIGCFSAFIFVDFKRKLLVLVERNLDLDFSANL